MDHRSRNNQIAVKIDLREFEMKFLVAFIVGAHPDFSMTQAGKSPSGWLT